MVLVVCEENQLEPDTCNDLATKYLAQISESYTCHVLVRRVLALHVNFRMFCGFVMASHALSRVCSRLGVSTLIKVCYSLQSCFFLRRRRHDGDRCGVAEHFWRHERRRWRERLLRHGGRCVSTCSMCVGGRDLALTLLLAGHVAVEQPLVASRPTKVLGHIKEIDDR